MTGTLPRSARPKSVPEFEGPIVRLSGIDKVYGQGPAQTWVLRSVTLDVAAGEFVSIMGPSGAGKSTLLHILGLQESQWDGEYWLMGRPVHSLSPRERDALRKQAIGFVYQQYHLLDDITVYENLEMPLSYRDLPRPERQARVAELLDRFGIVAKKDLYPTQLSGGQQQLVGIARAVAANPALILADEPTGNLHTDQGREIMELFTQLNREGTTIVQVTHSETNAGYGHRIVRLEDGRVVKTA
jgi:ABC-type lipoprotein export system ATPase subunit